LAPVVNPARGSIESVRPGIVTELAGMRHRVEDPDELSGFDIVAVNVSGNGFKAGSSGRQRNNDHVSDDTPRISRGILRRPVLLRIQSRPHIDDAILTKRCNRLARTRVDLFKPAAGD